MLFLRRFSAVIVFICLFTQHAFAVPDQSWFGGIAFYGFELNGTGTVSTIEDSDTEFNVKRFNAYGLVTTEIQTTESGIGLGWPDTQLPGFTLQLGYRHNWRFTTHFDMFWALMKSADQYGSPSTTDYTYFLAKQSTAYKQSHFRVMLDWTPFEPLPLWYFTGGIEYVKFSSRLEFHFDRYLNGEPNDRTFESYEDSGSTFGLVLGSGLILPGGSNRTQSYVSFTWCWAPYSKDWFAWDTDINVGGLGIELGYRVFFSSAEKQSKKTVGR